MTYNCYPLVFKQSIIRLYYKNKRKNISDILTIFKISKSSLYNWIQLFKIHKLSHKKKYKKKSKITPEIKCYIRAYVLRKKVFMYKKILSIIKKKYKIIISKTTLYNILNKLNITRKRYNTKFIYKNIQAHREDIKKFKQKIKKIKLNQIISIDETSIDTNIHNIYGPWVILRMCVAHSRYKSKYKNEVGWNMKGKQLYTKQYVKQRKRYTVIMALNNKKIIHYKLIIGSANAIDFQNFILETNKKYNLKNHYLLMDNARIHHAKINKSIIQKLQSYILFNVPYCPEYNPIEMVFSKLKLFIRQKCNNYSLLSLTKNIKNSVNQINKKTLDNYFKKSLR